MSTDVIVMRRDGSPIESRRLSDADMVRKYLAEKVQDRRVARFRLEHAMTGAIQHIGSDAVLQHLRLGGK